MKGAREPRDPPPDNAMECDAGARLMARGRKTGGRDFKKGEGGRKPGSRDEVPRTLKASIKRVYEEIAAEDPALIRRALEQGLRAEPPKSYPYLQLAAYYLDGRPVERIELQPGKPFIVQHRVWRPGQDPLAQAGPEQAVPTPPRALGP